MVQLGITATQLLSGLEIKVLGHTKATAKNLSK
jgi:hypothetical protein